MRGLAPKAEGRVAPKTGGVVDYSLIDFGQDYLAQLELIVQLGLIV